MCGLTFFLQTEMIQDLSGSARAPKYPASQEILDAVRSQVYHSETVRAHSGEHCIIGGWRELDNLTPHDDHHSSRIMRTYQTHFGIPLGIVPGWWDDRRRNHKPMLPLSLRLDISNNLSRALSCLRPFGHNFLVQRMRHNMNRRHYELRICDNCD